MHKRWVSQRIFRTSSLEATCVIPCATSVTERASSVSSLSSLPTPHALLFFLLSLLFIPETKRKQSEDRSHCYVMRVSYSKTRWSVGRRNARIVCPLFSVSVPSLSSSPIHTPLASFLFRGCLRGQESIHLRSAPQGTRRREQPGEAATAKPRQRRR